MNRGTFQAAKTHFGLDHYQCRGWTAWHRFTLLAMIALAILVITTAHHRPADIDARRDAFVPISIGDLRRLIAITISTGMDPATGIYWLWWRRRHQATARRSHYKRRDAATST